MKTTKRYSCSRAAALSALALGLPIGAQSAESTEPLRDQKKVVLASANTQQPYSLAFMNGLRAPVDVKNLLSGSDVLPGTYRVDLYLNSTFAGRRDITFLQDDAGGEPWPCFSIDMLQQLGVSSEKIEVDGKPLRPVQCYRLGELILDAKVIYDPASLRLNISMPQIYLNAARRGYIDPALWEDGVPVAFVNYNASTMHNFSSSRGASSSQQTNVSLRMGANLGPWRLRNNSFVSSGGYQGTQFTSQNTYVQRGFSGIKSQLALGETYTRSALFDSVRFLGVTMGSDEAMRPDSEQGYAPVIRGTAESNATIEVRQNGFLIYTTTVAPGPFEITDLAPSGSNGDLEITVIEADGRRRVTRQAFSSPPLMVREGRITYDAAVGQYREAYRGTDRPMFASGSMLYGLTGNLTLAGGAQLSQGYQALSTGVGLNTSAGAISLDATHARSDAAGDKASGTRWNLRYQKFIEATNTNVSVNYQQSFSQGFRSLADHVQAGSMIDDRYRYFASAAQVKSRVDGYMSQNLGSSSRYGNLYLSGSHSRLWDDSQSSSLTVGYSNSIGPVSYNLGYTHSRNVSSQVSRQRYSDDVVSLSLSFPLGRGSNAPQGYTALNRQSSGTSVQAGVTGRLPTEQDISYSLASGRDVDGDASGSAAISTTTSVGRLSASYSQGNQFRSGTLSANGSLVVHEGGVNLGQSLSDTFALAKVDPPVAGIAASSYSGVTTGSNGYAIVPSAMPFRGNWIQISARDVDTDIEFDNATQKVVPTRGAAALATFKADTGRRVQFEIVQADGQPIPFGATVDSVDGTRLGITDPRGRALTMITDGKDSGKLTVRWAQSVCEVPYTLPAREGGEYYLRIPVTCDPSAPALRRDKPAASDVG
ncbi:fimbrial biogenesis outer membrane usher protein [Paraburkholderia sp. Ac-20342]|uniref:fimbria/pilus outer membrane usher protein n=1 Tax=Paraburkholderia sp. Ac-20342 TaxID=2703889 RepID=UPI00197DFADA|nr:fimbria/pilus outer membrane usher protein [Paraburkholderia sp. Ac-20342]MBN3846952.1 fimbrial biogenesis outer membrane usher protein [Paraburkholderia sp. Ac-20342]